MRSDIPIKIPKIYECRKVYIAKINHLLEQVDLVIIGGHSGAGKSVLLAAYAQRLGQKNQICWLDETNVANFLNDGLDSSVDYLLIDQWERLACDISLQYLWDELITKHRVKVVLTSNRRPEIPFYALDSFAEIHVNPIAVPKCRAVLKQRFSLIGQPVTESNLNYASELVCGSPWALEQLVFQSFNGVPFYTPIGYKQLCSNYDNYVSGKILSECDDNELALLATLNSITDDEVITTSDFLSVFASLHAPFSSLVRKYLVILGDEETISISPFVKQYFPFLQNIQATSNEFLFRYYEWLGTGLNSTKHIVKAYGFLVQNGNFETVVPRIKQALTAILLDESLYKSFLEIIDLLPNQFHKELLYCKIECLTSLADQKQLHEQFVNSLESKTEQLFYRGLFCFKKRKDLEAKELFAEALEGELVSSMRFRATVYLGYLCSNIGDNQAALDILTKAEALKPEEVWPETIKLYHYMALVYGYKGSYEEAKSTLNRAERLARQFAGAKILSGILWYKAHLLASCLDYEQAKPVCVEALRLAESCVDIETQICCHILRADINYEKGDYELALISVNKGLEVLESRTGHLMSHLLRRKAAIYIASNNLKDADTCINSAYACLPKDDAVGHAFIDLTKAEFAIASDLPENAAEILETVISVFERENSSEGMITAYFLANLAFKMGGRLENASEMLEKHNYHMNLLPIHVRHKIHGELSTVKRVFAQKLRMFKVISKGFTGVLRSNEIAYFREQKSSYDLFVDFIKEEAYSKGKYIKLFSRPVLFKIFRQLIVSYPNSLTSSAIIRDIWQEKYESAHNSKFRVNLKRLRELFGDKGDQVIISPKKGFYRFSPSVSFCVIIEPKDMSVSG